MNVTIEENNSKMFKYVTNEDIKEHNTNLPENSNQKRTSANCIYHSSDIDFQGFINPYIKCTAKPDSLLVIDNTLVSDNSSCFTRNILESI